MTVELERTLARRGTTLTDVVARAMSYLLTRQLPDGSIAEDPDTLVIHNWDSVNALKAIALWREDIGFDDRGAIDRLVDYLASCEGPSGLIHPGFTELGHGGVYCTETSSEYIMALASLGQETRARGKAEVLRGRQLDSGAWALCDPNVPTAFHTFPCVTAFALSAILTMNVSPRQLDKALFFLVDAQKIDGQFGVNRFWYNTANYPVRAIVSVLAKFDCHTAVAAAHDFLRATQRSDGSWPPGDVEYQSALSAELLTALALEALGHAGLTLTQPPVRRGVLWLLGRQHPDGSWSGGRYPYPTGDGYPDLRAPQDVYATAQVLSTLRFFARQEVPR